MVGSLFLSQIGLVGWMCCAHGFGHVELYWKPLVETILRPLEPQ